MHSSADDGLFGRRIAPFGNPRIKACLPLPGAYRSLPRPSSPCDAKASTVRPFALVRFFKPLRAAASMRRHRTNRIRGSGPFFASILTGVAASRPPRSGSQLFASKPRARFDCLEIELLMSSHSNFSRLPLSKIVKSIGEPLFVLFAGSKVHRFEGSGTFERLNFGTFERRAERASWWA